MGAWGKSPASSPQGKTGHKQVVQAGAAAVNTLAKQYDKPVRWRLQGNLEERLKTWYQPVTRSAFTFMQPAPHLGFAHLRNKYSLQHQRFRLHVYTQLLLTDIRTGCNHTCE